MEKAIFKNREAAAALMAKTGKTWTTVSTKGGVFVRALMPWGWSFITTVNVAHLEAGAY
ncbi:hypothetical protein J2Y63_002431 [Shinella sp. BE166]|uniref:hypothetical protein n=1 Tax=Shinella sp. BE166 TaxID=3373918 RepID=UPI003EB725DD